MQKLLKKNQNKLDYLEKDMKGYIDKYQRLQGQTQAFCKSADKVREEYEKIMNLAMRLTENNNNNNTNKGEE